MQKAKVLTQRSAVALVNGGVSPNVPASDPSPRHAGLHETSALIMGNAKSQGLVLAQHCYVDERWCFFECASVRSTTTTSRASRHDGDGNEERGSALIMVNAKSQGLVTAQHCCVDERWCFPECASVKSITTDTPGFTT